MVDLLLGTVLRFTGDALVEGPGVAQVIPGGAVAIEGGKIAAVGPAADLRARFPQARVTDCGAALISAGFIDAHVHYAQTAMIASWASA